MENTSMSGFLEEVIDWINKTNDLLSQCSQSQSQISPLPDNDVDILINRFIGILQLKSCLENLSIVTKAVANLLIFIENVARKEDEIIFLIQQLINSFIKCYEVTHQKESDGLFQEINEIILVCTDEKNMKNQLLNGLMGNILSIVTSTTMHIWIRRNFLKLLTGLLTGSDRRERHKLWDEYYEYVNQLADYIFTCGDYDIQTYIVEILYRFSAKTDRTEIATVWFPNNAIVQSSFANIKDFECDCRIFLNNFNNALGENQLVYSLAAQSCHIGNTRVFKPPDLKYSQFWIDFNLGTGNLIIYCVKTPQSKEMWDTIILNSGEVTAVKLNISPSGETNLNLNLTNHVSELFSSSPASSTFLGKSVDIIFGSQPMIDYLQRILKIMYSDKMELKSRVRCSVAAMPRKIRNNKLVSSNKIIPPSHDTSSSKRNVDKLTTTSNKFVDTKTTAVTDTSHDGDNRASQSNQARQILPKTSKSGDLKIFNDMPGDLNSKFYPRKTSQILIKTSNTRDTNVGTGIAYDVDKVITHPRINSKIIKASKSGVSKISSDIVYDQSLDTASFSKSANPLNTSPDAKKIRDIDQDHNADVIAASQSEKEQKLQKSSKSADIKISSQVVHNSSTTQYRAKNNSTLTNKKVQEDAVGAKKHSKVSCPIDQNVRATNKAANHLYKGSTNPLISTSNSKQNQIALNPLKEISNLDHSKTYKNNKNNTLKASISSNSKITPGIYQLNSKQKTNVHEKENQTQTSKQKHFPSEVSIKQMSPNKIEFSEDVTVNSNYEKDYLSSMITGQDHKKENKISNSNANYSKVSVAHASKHIRSHKKMRDNVSLIVAENFSKLKTKNGVKTGLNSSISHNKQSKSDNIVLSQNENIKIVENPEVAENSTQSAIGNTVKTNENVTQIGMVKEIYSKVDLQSNEDLNVHIDLHANKIQSKSDYCILSQKEKNEDEIVNTSEIDHKSPQSVDVNLIEIRNNATQIDIEKEPNYSTNIKDNEDLNVHFYSITSHNQSKIVSNCSVSQKEKTEIDVDEIANTTEIKTSQQYINTVESDVNENQMEIVKGLNSSELENKESLNFHFDSVTDSFQIKSDSNKNPQLKNKEIPKKNKLRKSKVKKKRSPSRNVSVETCKPVSISDNKSIQINVNKDKASDEVESNNINVDKDEEKKLEKKNSTVKCDSVNMKEQNNKHAVNDIRQVVDITEAVLIPPNNENSMNNSVDNSSETLITEPNKNSKLTLSRGRNRAIRKLSRVNQPLKDLKSKKCLSFNESPIVPSATKGLVNDCDDQARNLSNVCQTVHDQLPKDTCSVGESISESSNFLDLEQSETITKDVKENVAISVDVQIGIDFIASPLQQEINTIKIAEQNAKMTMSGGRKRATRSCSRVQKKLAGGGFALKKTLTYIESDLNLNEGKAENVNYDQSINNVDLDKEVIVSTNDSFYEKDKVNYNEISKQSDISPESKTSKQNIDCNEKKGESKIQSEVTHDNICENVVNPTKKYKSTSKNSFHCSNLGNKNMTLKKTFDKGNMVKQKLGNLISITGVTPLIKYTEKTSNDENISPIEVDHCKSLQNCSLDANSTIKSSEERTSSRKKKLHSIKPNVLEEINSAEENITTVLKTPTFEDVYGSRQKKEGKESTKQTRRRKVRPFNKRRDVTDASKNKTDHEQGKSETLPPLIVKRKEKPFLSSTVVGLGSNAPSVLDASEILPTKKRKFFQYERKDYDSIHKEERWTCFKLRQRKRINYDESLFDSVGSPAGDSVAKCSNYSKKRQREKVELESSSKYDSIDDDTPFGKQIKLSDWRDKCSQKRMKVKKYGPSKTKTKTKPTSFSRASEVNFHAENKELKQNDKNTLRKDENTETKAYSDVVPNQNDEDIERIKISQVEEDALSRLKRNYVKGSNLDQISVAFDNTIIRLHNQIQQISDLPKDEKAVYCPKAKKLAELSHMLIFNLLL